VAILSLLPVSPSERQQIRCHFLLQDFVFPAKSTLIGTIFQFSISNSTAITPLASYFKLGAATNLNAPTEISRADYSDEFVYQQCLQKVLAPTSKPEGSSIQLIPEISSHISANWDIHPDTAKFVLH